MMSESRHQTVRDSVRDGGPRYRAAVMVLQSDGHDACVGISGIQALEGGFDQTHIPPKPILTTPKLLFVTPKPSLVTSNSLFACGVPIQASVETL
jgi:hypothetical protein